MTTVAFDGKTLCTDSQGNGGFTSVDPVQKLWTFPGGGEYLAAAFVGSYGDKIAVMDWALKGYERPNFKEDSMLLLIDLSGECLEYHTGCLGPSACGKFAAQGSGAQFAAGAMMAGATAFMAVEAAIKLDPDSGGPVQCFDLTTKTLTGPFECHT